MVALIIIAVIGLVLILAGGAGLNNFSRGDLIVFNMTPSGGANVTLGIKSHNIDLECAVNDVTNTRHGGGTAVLGSKENGKGTVSAALDLDEMPHDAPFTVRPRMKGIMFFGLSPALAIQFPFMVTSLHYETAVESEVRWSFSVTMDVISGSLVYPD